MKLTTAEVLDWVQQSRNKQHATREVVLVEPKTLPEVTREVYKEEKIKRNNYGSRVDEELLSDDSSSRFLGRNLPSPSLLPSSADSGILASETSFPPMARTSSETPNPQVIPQEVLHSVIPPTRTTSREYAGITAQHVKTKKGVKVNITMQDHDDAKYGDKIDLTAELKRHARIYELKPYIHDSADFADIYEAFKNTIKDSEEYADVCIGRLHRRGKRDSWIPDIFVSGTLDNQGKIVKVRVFTGTEIYDIDMDLDLSKNQETIFHTSGRYGTLTSVKQVETLKTIERTPYNP